MKTTKILNLTILSLFIILLSSCSTKLNFLNSSVVPAAQGAAKVSRDGNNNYELNINVTNLAEPSRLQPKKALYVVWLVTKDNVTKNIGQLKSSSGFFSSTLEGNLTTVSPFKPEYVFITAEDSAAILYPVGTVILTTKAN